MPYIRKVFEDNAEMQLVHMMVGSMSGEQERDIASALLPYFEDPENVFVISSDFCHWGERFSYVHIEQSISPIHASIEALDRRGMALIEAQDLAAFQHYLRETKKHHMWPQSDLCSPQDD
eukprot:TRINITY_DN9373_c0_g1_i1.p1 TRINITY_DN9373_c0_g1~~TRINITY_DN9373_c0_g1_i1.p1  ORF type:complete len:120 (+),score=21.45 TRINITY_DN9373_c0_g1_i1:405-764(+)